MGLRVSGKQRGAEWRPEEDQRTPPLCMLRRYLPASARCYHILREHGHGHNPAEVTHLCLEGPVEVYVGRTTGE